MEDNLVTEQLLDFYRHHDGATLFLDVTSDRAGLHLLPIGSWKRLQSVVIELYGEFREEFGLEWLDHFVAFGEVPHSGNYFVMPTHGTSAGNVIYCDHEGPTFLDWAPDFHTFLRLFLDSPCEQIYQLGSFLRFDEHGSDRQWIPERFFAGENFRRE
ncbi:SMI1/KNR4 family protein [bacterium]|nr:SMI1/KNR4 family protein [bacterium]